MINQPGSEKHLLKSICIIGLFASAMYFIGSLIDGDLPQSLFATFLIVINYYNLQRKE